MKLVCVKKNNVVRSCMFFLNALAVLWLEHVQARELE